MEVSKRTINPGNGVSPANGNRVTVHYIAKTDDGRVIDSTGGRREPFSFNLGKGEVIKGWDQAIPTMSIGEKAIITCAPELAYGDQAVGGLIPPNSTLIFEVELLSFK
jgi:FKBP-type peptidyl-prolyl cis-trans isomerase